MIELPKCRLCKNDPTYQSINYFGMRDEEQTCCENDKCKIFSVRFPKSVWIQLMQDPPMQSFVERIREHFRLVDNDSLFINIFDKIVGVSVNRDGRSKTRFCGESEKYENVDDAIEALEKDK